MNLPQAPEPNSPLPHAGLDYETLEEAKANGWDPIDIRVLTPSRRRVELILQGLTLGTVELTKNQFEALELEAKLFMNQEPEKPKPVRLVSTDVLDALKAIPTSVPFKEALADREALPPSRRKAPKGTGPEEKIVASFGAKRGRPIGVKDSTKRTREDDRKELADAKSRVDKAWETQVAKELEPK